MGQITQFPGAADFLTRGLLAGAKLRAIQTETQNLQLQNQLAQEEIEFGEGRDAMIDAINQAELENKTAQTGLANARAQALADVEVTREKKEKRTAAVESAKAARSLLSDSLDDTPTDAEAHAIMLTAIPQLKTLGVEAPEGSPNFQYWKQQVLNEALVAAEDRDIEREKAQSINEFRAAQVADTLAGVVTPERTTELRILTNQVNELDKALKDINQGISVFSADDPERAVLEAQKVENRDLREELMDSLRSVVNKNREGKAKKVSDSGLPVVTTDADYDALDPGTEFEDENGERFRKPK